MKDKPGTDGFLIGQLTAQVYQLTEEVSKMQLRLSLSSELAKENQLLKDRIAELELRLAQFETTKNSSNSNRPPSSDFPKQNKTNSLRTPSGKKPGGQRGHDGNTLKMVETPDIVEDHKPNYCLRCGRDLSSIPLELEGKRQVIDIPPIEPVVTEHRIYKQVCTCGHCNQGSFPNGVDAPVSYGAGVQSLISYLYARHYMPVARTAEFLKDILHIPVSTGGICYLLNKAKEKALPAYKAIRLFVLGQPVIGGDETSVNINGKNHWAWTFQCKRATYIAVHPSRGTAAIDDIMPEGFANNTLVTDCWASYFKKGAMSHQLCTAHLQRDLNYLAQRFPENTWVKRMAALINNALGMHRDGKLQQVKVDEIHRSFDLLLKEPATNKDFKELKTFQKRMVKHKVHIFRFLDDPTVPPDNNGSERAIRNFKVKQKVSGFFKSEDGSATYAILRSIIDTTIKNGQNPYLALKTIAST